METQFSTSAKPHGGKLSNQVLVGDERGRAQDRAKELLALAITEETGKDVQNIAP